VYLLNSALSSSLTFIMHHNGCVNGYVIKRLSDVLTLYLSNEMVNDVLTLSNYAVSITVGIASEAEMKVIYSVAKKCLNESI
jgi:hypothetical protein